MNLLLPFLNLLPPISRSFILLILVLAVVLAPPLLLPLLLFLSFTLSCASDFYHGCRYLRSRHPRHVGRPRRYHPRLRRFFLSRRFTGISVTFGLLSSVVIVKCASSFVDCHLGATGFVVSIYLEPRSAPHPHLLLLLLLLPLLPLHRLLQHVDPLAEVPVAFTYGIKECLVKSDSNRIAGIYGADKSFVWYLRCSFFALQIHVVVRVDILNMVHYVKERV